MPKATPSASRGLDDGGRSEPLGPSARPGRLCTLLPLAKWPIPHLRSRAAAVGHSPPPSSIRHSAGSLIRGCGAPEFLSGMICPLLTRSSCSASSPRSSCRTSSPQSLACKLGAPSHTLGSVCAVGNGDWPARASARQTRSPDPAAFQGRRVQTVPPPLALGLASHEAALVAERGGRSERPRDAVQRVVPRQREHPHGCRIMEVHRSNPRGRQPQQDLDRSTRCRANSVLQSDDGTTARSVADSGQSA